MAEQGNPIVNETKALSAESKKMSKLAQRGLRTLRHTCVELDQQSTALREELNRDQSWFSQYKTNVEFVRRMLEQRRASLNSELEEIDNMLHLLPKPSQ